MKFLVTRYSCAFFLMFMLLALLSPSEKFAYSDTTRPATGEGKSSEARPRADYANLPLSFEANVGQSDQQVRFLSRNRGYNLFLTAKEAVLAITPSKGSSLEKDFSAKQQSAPLSVVRIKPDGANTGAIIEGLEQLETKSNYLVGRDSQRWHPQVAHYAKVAYREVYPGIDLVYYGNQRQIEYDFVLSPGADASRIRLDISGAKSLKIADNGDLLINTASGLLRQLAPKAYQDMGGTRQEVASRYVLLGKRKIGFALGNYDKSKPLIIDPVLSYATLLGGTGAGGDWGNSISVDSNGNMYVTGYTTATNFPTTSGAFQTTFGGAAPAYDAFVTKLNASGTGIVYSTYIGGSGSDVGNAIAVDASGNAYISGHTYSANFPVTAGAYQSIRRGNSDAFALKLNSTGSALLYSTYLGGDASELGGRLEIDSVGNAYIAGRTYSSNFPTTSGAFQTLSTEPIGSGGADGFVTKLNPSGSSLLYSTFLGGSAEDLLTGLALGADGSVYLTGSTVSLNFPTTPEAFQRTKSGASYDEDVFVTRLNPNGNAALYSTYVGGIDLDRASAIAVDPTGNAFVTGITRSASFPTTPGAYQTNLNRLGDGFIFQINPSGTGLVYSTYVGGENDDEACGIALDSTNNAVIVGATDSRSFPTSADAFQRHFGGNRDAFVTKINSAGSQIIYSSFIGDSDYDRASGVTLDSQSRAYITGGTYSGQFSVTQGRYWNASYGESDVFVVRINLNETGYSVSGQVTNDLGNPLIGVEVSLNGSLIHKTCTDANGFYSIGSLPAGANVTVSANRYGATLSPSGATIANLSQNETVDFSGPASLLITGRIVDNSGNGIPLEVTLTGAYNTVIYTDNEGYYTFRYLSAGESYTVTPMSTFYTFSPASSSSPNLDGDKEFNFTAVSPPSIEGRILDESGNGTGGVTVALSGTTFMATTTDYTGRYKFYFLPSGGNYTITPSYYSSSRFSPTSQTVENLTSDQTRDFTILYPLIISGRIADNYGTGISGLAVSLTGTTSATTYTGYDGSYWFFELPAGGTFTVTPTSQLYTFAPASETFTDMTTNSSKDFAATTRQLTISGQVEGSFGGTIAGVTMTLGGAQSATTQTDSNGNYSFTGLAVGGSFSVVPTKAGYTFTPANANFNSLYEDGTANFQGQFNGYTISGRLIDSGGSALGGVSVALSGAMTGNTQTDVNGNYLFSSLSPGGNYTVTPSLTYFTFSPANRSFTNLSSFETADFTGTRVTFSISGHITDSASAALAGVSVTLTGAQSGSTQSDSNGNYSFSALASEGNYTVTPTLSHYTFSPISKSFTNLLGNQTADFTGTRLTYTINGRVTNSSSVGQGGVSVALTGGQSASTQTDAAGNYSFTAVFAGLNYTVTPAKNHYSFSPASRSFTELSNNQSADFTATLLQHNITGIILNSGGSPMAGVGVALSGAQTGSATTDANGNYAFVSLLAGGNYVVSPSKQFYLFSPANQSFNDLSGNQTANFTGTLLTYSITGRVTEGSVGVAGVVVALGGSQTASVQTDAAGYFAFNGLPAGSTYTVTPSHPFFAFSPSLRSFPTLGQNQTSDFSATRLTYQVSGSVQNACGQAIAGVTMTLLRNGVPVTTPTNASGVYSFTGVQAGFNYSLTPALTGHTFNPTSANFVALNGSQVANFIGRPPTATVNVQPTADAYVRGGSSANSNFGTTTQLITRLASSASNTYESYLTFDVGQLCTASSVKLRLYGKVSSSGNLGVSAYSVANTSWVETSINWNNKPVTGTLLATTTLTGTTNAWYEWDITQYVQNELSAGRRIISIALKGVASTSNQVTLNSRQATSNKPELRIIKP